MQKSIAPILVSTLLLSVLAACGGGGGDAPAVVSGAPGPAPAPAPAPVQDVADQLVGAWYSCIAFSATESIAIKYTFVKTGPNQTSETEFQTRYFSNNCTGALFPGLPVNPVTYTYSTVYSGTKTIGSQTVYKSITTETGVSTPTTTKNVTYVANNRLLFGDARPSAIRDAEGFPNAIRSDRGYDRLATENGFAGTYSCSISGTDTGSLNFTMRNPLGAFSTCAGNTIKGGQFACTGNVSASGALTSAFSTTGGSATGQVTATGATANWSAAAGEGGTINCSKN